MPVLTFARYILETSLMEYELNVEISDSKLAAAALILALKIEGKQDFEATLEYYSGYSISECKEIVMKLHKMLRNQRNQPKDGKRTTIRTKYEHKWAIQNYFL